MAKGYFGARKDVCNFCGVNTNKTELKRFGKSNRLRLCKKCAISNKYKWSEGRTVKK
jgi:hypothetical protein